jgi:hypothetical protein
MRKDRALERGAEKDHCGEQRGRNRAVPQIQRVLDFAEKEGILGLNRPFLGLNRGKIGGLMLPISQQGEIACY